MHNLEDMIEKYRRELVEFSKQESVRELNSGEMAESVPTMASALPFVADVGNDRETEKYPSYEDFVRLNPSSGLMKIQATSGGTSFPIINAAVKISIPLGEGDREIFSGYTDINGIIDNISLPAPNSSFSLDETNTTVVPYAVYAVSVSHPEFAKSDFFNVPVFSGTKSIQPVRLVPLTETGEEPGTVNTPNPTMVLYGVDV